MVIIMKLDNSKNIDSLNQSSLHAGAKGIIPINMIFIFITFWLGRVLLSKNFRVGYFIILVDVFTIYLSWQVMKGSKNAYFINKIILRSFVIIIWTLVFAFFYALTHLRITS